MPWSSVFYCRTICNEPRRERDGLSFVFKIVKSDIKRGQAQSKHKDIIKLRSILLLFPIDRFGLFATQEACKTLVIDHKTKTLFLKGWALLKKTPFFSKFFFFQVEKLLFPLISSRWHTLRYKHIGTKNNRSISKALFSPSWNQRNVPNSCSI